MFSAEVHGKVSITNPPHQRMEDVLTSYVFSLFRYLNNLQAPLAFLREAKNLNDEKLEFDDLVSAQVCFWPRFNFPGIGFREPDVLLLLEEKGGGKIAAVIEAKYYSGLSNRVNDENGIEEEDQSATTGPIFHYGHQLADQYCGVMCGRWNDEEVQNKLSQINKKVLLYVTTHYELPNADLDEATETILKRAKTKCKNKGIECWRNCKTAIYWIGWRCLHDLITQNKIDYTGGELYFLSDLQEVLESRDLKPFQATFNCLVDVEQYKQLFGNGISTK